MQSQYEHKQHAKEYIVKLHAYNTSLCSNTKVKKQKAKIENKKQPSKNNNKNQTPCIFQKQKAKSKNSKANCFCQTNATFLNINSLKKQKHHIMNGTHAITIQTQATCKGVYS